MQNTSFLPSSQQFFRKFLLLFHCLFFLCFESGNIKCLRCCFFFHISWLFTPISRARQIISMGQVMNLAVRLFQTIIIRTQTKNACHSKTNPTCSNRSIHPLSLCASSDPPKKNLSYIRAHALAPSFSRGGEGRGLKYLALVQTCNQPQLEKVKKKGRIPRKKKPKVFQPTKFKIDHVTRRWRSGSSNFPGKRVKRVKAEPSNV